MKRYLGLERKSLGDALGTWPWHW